MAAAHRRGRRGDVTPGAMALLLIVRNVIEMEYVQSAQIINIRVIIVQIYVQIVQEVLAIQMVLVLIKVIIVLMKL